MASDMWRRGETAKTIGIAIGKSRNSVIGKMHRLKIETLNVVKRPGPPRVVKRNSTVIPAKVAKITRTQPTRKPPAGGVTMLELEKPPAGGVTMLELKDRMCRWPLSAARSCGRDTGDRRKSYCEMHASVSYTPGREPRALARRR